MNLVNNCILFIFIYSKYLFTNMICFLFLIVKKKGVSSLRYIKTAEMLFHLIPTIDIKFIRPVSLHFKPQHTPLQLHILAIVKEKKSTMTELSTETLLSKQQMTPVIDKLVAEGLVQREYDAVDRRITRINITPAGLQLLEQTKEQATKLLQDKIALLDEQDLTSLNNALSELARIFHKLP